MRVEIPLLEGKVKYLGLMITFVDQETTEVQHRLRCAWSAFAKHRHETTPAALVVRCCHTDSYIRSREMGYNKKNAPHHSTQGASCRHANIKERLKHRKNLEKTFVTTKYARIHKKKTAHMMNATKTEVFHSMMMKSDLEHWNECLKRSAKEADE